VEEFDFEVYKMARFLKEFNEGLLREAAEEKGLKEVPEVNFEDLYTILMAVRSWTDDEEEYDEYEEDYKEYKYYVHKDGRKERINLLLNLTEASSTPEEEEEKDGTYEGNEANEANEDV
jgi:hypothetical protein